MFSCASKLPGSVSSGMRRVSTKAAMRLRKASSEAGMVKSMDVPQSDETRWPPSTVTTDPVI